MHMDGTQNQHIVMQNSCGLPLAEDCTNRDLSPSSMNEMQYMQAALGKHTLLTPAKAQGITNLWRKTAPIAVGKHSNVQLSGGGDKAPSVAISDLYIQWSTHRSKKRQPHQSSTL